MSASSPRRFNSQDNVISVSPRPHRHAFPPRLGSFSDFESASRPNVVVGFTPPPSAGLPSVAEGSTSNATSSSTFPVASPRSRGLHLQTSTPAQQAARLSPQLSTPVEQTFNLGMVSLTTSPRHLGSSPRGVTYAELPPRSRRNSAAIVSISLSSRSRSRTPRGGAAALPQSDSGHATPNKDSTTPTPRPDGTPSKGIPVKDLAEDDWQPTGGMLLDDGVGDGRNDEAVVDDDLDDDGRQWTFDDEGDDERAVEDVLSPGMLFGEGQEFQGEIVQPAVRQVAGESGAQGYPLRRGESEIGKTTRGDPAQKPKKVYEVIRQLGSGSYAVVYLVREKGGRKREYALKCLSKQDLEPEQIETQLFEATIHLSLPIHKNIVTLHQTFHTKRWLFLMLELCPGEDLFYWLEKSRDASPPVVNHRLPEESHPMSSSKFSSSSIPFSSSQMFPNINSHFGSSISNSPTNHFTGASHGTSPASLLFAHHNNHSHSSFAMAQTPPTPSLLSAFAANTLLSPRRLRLIASMFSQMCESVAVCHDAGVSHRDIKPENFICCDSVELESAVTADAEDDDMDFGPQAKRKVIVKLTDFGLATAEVESGDVECGSKPYMSYECRNNLGPTYLPAPADVWSLGIVLINMLFHRNPWKDPTPGDPNFDKFLRDPTGFLLAKFTGIGREVATYLAEHVLCTEVEDRVTAREFGKWIKGLTEMIAGRKAVNALKLARIEAKNDKSNGSMFAKAPVNAAQSQAKNKSSSALTNSAPIQQAVTAPSLSSLPPPSTLVEKALETAPDEVELTTPDLDKDVEGEELASASTVDGQMTPADSRNVVSPEVPDPDTTEPPANVMDSDAQSLSTHKRRKRGARKGKAAQAAALAAAQTDDGTKQGRDMLLSEFAAAAQSLARDLSKKPRRAEVDSPIEFPPLGTTPNEISAVKKSKWKDLMKFSSDNPELQALARRVAERDGSSGGNWSAPAKLQQDANRYSGASRPGLKQSYTQTATMSSGFSSGLSSFGPVSSATSSSGGVDDEDWRKRVPEDKVDEDSSDRQEAADAADERQFRRHRGREEDLTRARQAALAAAALTGGLDTMGHFGAGPGSAGVHRKTPVGGYNNRTSIPIGTQARLPALIPSQTTQGISHRLTSTLTSDESNDLPNGDAPPKRLVMSSSVSAPMITKHSMGNSSLSSEPTTVSRPIIPSKESSQSTITTSISPPSTSSYAHGSTTAVDQNASPGSGGGPNKPKLKGQIQSLAKMLSGLKTKGKD
ncbi:hypothetical protein BD324DRAFT_610564 [Kockovaella imperatae]|uniref:Protein kinase domain-containing protein n=1 Tax=Kockovaella imperatae TaxID=4999 RepID=A0A1Y1U6B6_9TREE|nr:hypothetical protein BD324DRAFT_610564 [Kockovaella imperatae]ORX33580.1 hypothetical protein BD324DRAFT_610564 [Kockovaella imperatae]